LTYHHGAPVRRLRGFRGRHGIWNILFCALIVASLLVMLATAAWGLAAGIRATHHLSTDFWAVTANAQTQVGQPCSSELQFEGRASCNVSAVPASHNAAQHCHRTVASPEAASTFLQVATLRTTVSNFFEGVTGLQAVLSAISTVLAGEHLICDLGTTRQLLALLLAFPGRLFVSTV
jgi:hypothetical protein